MTTTTTTTILDLWKAMGEAGIQPEGIEYVADWETFLIYGKNGDGVEPKDDHIGFILTGRAETWLKEKKWNIMYNPRLERTWYEPTTWGFIECWRYSETHDPYSLPDALRSEIGRGK